MVLVRTQNGLLEKWWPQKDALLDGNAMIDQIGVCSHHLRSLLAAIRLTVLHVIVCRVLYFDV